MKKIAERKNRNRRLYLSVISLAALSYSGTVSAQINNAAPANVPAPDNSTKVVNAGNSTNVTDLGNITIVGKLNQARSQIVPSLGASVYIHTQDQIQSQSQGDNAPLNQIILRSPGVVLDSAVDDGLHVRGEMANVQYRINDVLLPEGITGFGLEIDPRYVDTLQLITGSLPAQYGFRTSGIVDIQSKSGAFVNGGEAEIYGGSFDTIRPSFEYGGTSGNWNYFVDGGYEYNALGIENPTPSYNAIHDDTDQYKTFLYASRILSDTARVSFIGSASYSDFQIPNTPGLPVGTAPGGDAWNTTQGPATFNSSDLNERQNEQNYYGVVAYQKSAGDFNGQLSVFGRGSGVHFLPDPVGDLYFNGVASDVDRILYSGGVQADASYDLGDKHTIRGGAMALAEFVNADSTTTVFNVDTNGNPTGAAYPIVDNHNLNGQFYGLYLQDEWKIFPEFIVNYGARFDVFNSSFDNENQISPRINFIYQPTDWTTLHAGYSRYFTPPQVENVSGGDIALFNGTSNASEETNDSPVKAERANYFDAGISQKVAPGLQVGADGYYKTTRNQLDDGLFGQTLIPSGFNYAHGKIYGVDFTASYAKGGFSAYANVAWSKSLGKGAASAQFLWGNQYVVDYVNSHWIDLDHDQRVTSSAGVAYKWSESARYGARLYADAIYGSGLHQDGPATIANDPDDDLIPNGSTVPSYYTINVGAEQSFEVGRNQLLKARLDIVNLTDNIYEIRSGASVGVNAPAYGERLGFFGSISYVF